MDEKQKELVGIGASVGAHCQPCLDYHLAKARELGISESDIMEAVEIGFKAESGSSKAMKKFADSVLEKADSATKPCCSQSKPKSCCADN